MEEKNALVLEYINGIRETFERNGNPISDETVRQNRSDKVYRLRK